MYGVRVRVSYKITDSFFVKIGCYLSKEETKAGKRLWVAQRRKKGICSRKEDKD